MSLVLGVATLSCVDASASSPFAIHDYKNRLVGVTEKSSSTPISQYVYFSDNRRAGKTVFASSETTSFFYDGWQVCEESGASNATFVWNPVYVDELVRMDKGGQQFYVHQNARCDVVAVTNGAGGVVEKRFYSDYGEVLDEAKQPTAMGATPYGFQGRRLDPETGLYYFRARYYDPYAGRFLQRDPIYDPANLGNQYTYAANNPVNYLDPMGTDVTMSAGDAAAMGNVFGAGNITTRPAGNGQVTVGFSDPQAAAKASYDFVQRTQGDMGFRLRMWQAINSSRTSSLADVRSGRSQIDWSQGTGGPVQEGPAPRPPGPTRPEWSPYDNMPSGLAAAAYMANRWDVWLLLLTLGSPVPGDEAAAAGVVAGRGATASEITLVSSVYEGTPLVTATVQTATGAKTLNIFYRGACMQEGVLVVDQLQIGGAAAREVGLPTIRKLGQELANLIGRENGLSSGARVRLTFGTRTTGVGPGHVPRGRTFVIE